MAADIAAIEYKSKSVKSALGVIAERYRQESGSPYSFVFIETIGFAEVLPEKGKRVRRGLQEEIRDAGKLLSDLRAVLVRLSEAEDLEAAYNSIRLRTLLRAVQVAHYNVSHRMMRDLLFISPRNFTSVASLYNDITNLQKLINAVRYGETERSFADRNVVKLLRRISGRTAKVTKILSGYADQADSTATDEMFGEHNMMAYRYRNSFFVNVELLLDYLGIDRTQNKATVAKLIRGREAEIMQLLDALEKSDQGDTELLSRS